MTELAEFVRDTAALVETIASPHLLVSTGTISLAYMSFERRR